MKLDQPSLGGRFLVAVSAFLLALPGMQVAFAEGEDDAVIEEVVVTGIRGSIRQSIDMKRDADNIVDALVAEDIGKFPDQNLAESLQRVPGVAIDRVRGEGSQISIRGLGPQFVRVQVNGRSALSGAGGSFAGAIGGLTGDRSFRFEGMQAELVQAVEVYKSAQANLLEGGMGGTVNIRTRRPFDNGGRRILAGNAVVTDDDLADDNGYRAAGVWSDTFAENTFGVLVSVAADDRTTREDWFNIPDYEPKIFRNAVDQNGNLLRGCALPGVANPDVGCGYTGGNVRMGIVIEDKQRLNLSSALQWRPNEDLEITLDLLHSELQREYTDYQNPLRTQAGLAGQATEVHLNEDDVTTYFATNGSRPRPFPRDFDTETEQQQFAVNLKFTPTERLEFNVDLSHATGDVDEIQTTTYYDIAGGAPATYDINTSYVPKISVDADLSDPNVYTFSYFQDQVNLSEDEETQFRADATYHFDDGTAFHAGVSYRKQERMYLRRGIAIGTRFGDFIGEPLTAVDWHELPVDDAWSGIDGSDTWPKQWLSADPDSVRQTYLVDRRDEIPPERFTAADSASSEDFGITEDTLGAYFMMEMAGSIGDIPWSGNAGARWVRVERDSTGNVQPIDNVVFSEASGVFVFLLLPAEFQTHSNRFAEVLPALNLQAVEAGRREAPSDGLDLNRVFPGDPAGSIAQVTASFVDEVILPLSDIVLDVHSGGRSMHFPGSLWLLECADAEMMSRTLDAAGAFGAPYTIVSPSLGGDMSEAAVRHGCLYLSTELSGGGAVNPDFLAVIERGIGRLIVHLGMVDGKSGSLASPRMMAVKGGEGIVSAPCHGLFEPYVCVEHRVRAGEPLGCIHSVIAPGNAGLEVLSPVDGMVYGLRWPAHVRRAERIAIIATDD